MSYSIRIAIFIVISVVGVVPSAFAQPRWGSGPQPRAGVCFYEDINFRGRYFCARSGETLPSVPSGLGDRISSLRIIGRNEVMVFKDTRFRGPSAQFSTDVRNLKAEGWNDLISSLRVRRASFSSGGQFPSWGNRPTPRDGACFYKGANFRGQYFCMPRGASYALVPPGFNDQISSIRVMRSGVMIFMDRDYTGRSTRIVSDTANLRGTWRDHISSIRVF